MGTLPDILFVLYILIMLGGVVMMLRNYAVFNYRTRLLRLVGIACRDDIVNGRAYYWRFDTFGTVEYDQMMLRPWRPLSSFYPDMNFARVGATDPKLTP